MPNRVPVVGCTEARHSSMSTSLSSGGISRHTLMGVSELRRQSRLRVTFSLTFHYVMAKIVPVIQLAAHVNSSAL